MITHLEADILECEVKWALGSITTSKISGGEGIPYEFFKILKDDAVKLWHSICSKFEKLDWKRSVFIPITKKSRARKCSYHWTVSFILHASKVVLKILQARFQQYMNQELSDVQVKKTQRNQRSNCKHPLDHRKCKRIPEKYQLLPH